VNVAPFTGGPSAYQPMNISITISYEPLHAFTAKRAGQLVYASAPQPMGGNDPRHRRYLRRETAFMISPLVAKRGRQDPFPCVPTCSTLAPRTVGCTNASAPWKAACRRVSAKWPSGTVASVRPMNIRSLHQELADGRQQRSSSYVGQSKNALTSSPPPGPRTVS